MNDTSSGAGQAGPSQTAQDIQPGQTTAGAGQAQQSGSNAPIVVSALYTVGMFLLPFLANLAGLIWAYVARGSAVEWERSVLTYQIRTFWISLLYGLILAVAAVVTFGFAYLLALPLLVWYIVRLVKMWMASTRREAIASELSWLW